MARKRPSTHFVTPHCLAHRWPRRTSLPSVFTAFVRDLQGERTPDADLFHDVWHALRGALVREMKRRRLWSSPPCFLGVHGYKSWESEETGAAGSSTRDASSPVAELVADCYAYVFVDRLPALKRCLEEKPDIDGLVLLNIRHFLHERQRDYDPLGFRIFELLHDAIELAVARGELRVAAGDTSIRNETLLAFAAPAAVSEIGAPAPPPPNTAPASPPPPPRNTAPSATAPPLPNTAHLTGRQPGPTSLEQLVTQWNDELLPALVDTRHRQRTAVVERLRARVLELPCQGVQSFRLRDLLDPMKSDARRRWAAMFAESGGACAELLAGPARPWPGEPSTTREVESRQSFEHLTRNVAASIDRLPADARTRDQLACLWQHLRHQSTDEATLSHRQLGQRLKISRPRLPRLFALLRQIVSACQTAAGGARGASLPGGAPPPGAPRSLRSLPERARSVR